MGMMACIAVSRGEKVIIPPRWDPTKNETCNCKLDRRWTPQKIHSWNIDKLQKIHADHCNGVKGPKVYKEMFDKLRTHFRFYHGWQ